jgi:hypothetical protein
MIYRLLRNPYNIQLQGPQKLLIRTPAPLVGKMTSAVLLAANVLFMRPNAQV